MAAGASEELVASSSQKADEELDMPFADALALLELSNERGRVPEAVNAFLRDHLDQLKAPDNPFPRSKTAADDLAKGQLAIRGTKTTVDATERDLALQVAQRFDLNEIESLLALRAVNAKRVGKMKEDDWDKLTAWVFEERMAVIGVVALLLRCYEDEDHPCYQLSHELLPSILTSTFGDALLKAFESRARKPLPESVRSSAPHATFWATQLVREQKALLEVLFLLYYAPQQPNSDFLREMLSAVQKTEWGTKQETFAFLDDDARQIVSEISGLLTILLVEALNLEVAMDTEHVIPAPGEKALPTESYFHPDKIVAVHQVVEALAGADPARSSALTLGWAFLLSKVTNDLLDHGVPDQYHQVAASILRVSGQSRPMYQLLVSHSLSPQSRFFQGLVDLTRSSLFGQSDIFTINDDDPNAVGYVSVVRGLLHVVPQLIHVSYLTPDQYDGLVQAFASVYSTKAAILLSMQLWEVQRRSFDSLDNEHAFGEELQIIELAKSRFPVQMKPLLSLIEALCRGPSNLLLDEDAREEDIERGANCMETAFKILGELPSFTHVVDTTPTVAPLPYEILTYPDSTDLIYKATRSIQTSRSLTIPAGTIGQLVSPEGAKPVVLKWTLTWSAWRLFGDILEDFAQMRKGFSSSDDVFATPGKVGLPVRWDSDEDKRADIVAILDILALVVRENTAIAQALVQHIEAGQPTGKRFHFVEVLIRILERALAGSSATDSKLATAAIRAVTALLPAFPGVIWTLLQSSSLLFNSPSQGGTRPYSGSKQSVLDMERLTSTYPVCRGLVKFVHALVIEHQTTALASTQDFLEIKTNVLKRALTWLRDEVWVVHSSWKFAILAERYELTRSVIAIFDTVTEDVELCRSPTSAGLVGRMVIQALLSDTSIEDIAPLITLICAGAEPIMVLRKSGRFIDAHQLEKLCDASMVLVLRLLRTHRRVTPDRLSLVEKLCLSHNTPAAFGAGANVEMLQRLTTFVTTQIASSIAIHATELIKSLALVPVITGTNNGPSFIALLGGADAAEKFVLDVFDLATDLSIAALLRVAVWDMLAAIVTSRPGLAMLVISGRHFLLPTDLSTSSKNDTKRALPSPKALKQTAVNAALETVSSWETEWEQNSVVLSAVLRFLVYTWERHADFAPALESLRTNDKFWAVIASIAFEPTPLELIDEGDHAVVCYLTAAKTSATALIALDAGLPHVDPTNSKSIAAFVRLASDQGALARALSQAIMCTCDPDANQSTLDLVKESCPNLHLDDLRIPSDVHPLLSPREFGSDYLYSLRMLRRRLDGLMGQTESIVDIDAFSDIAEQVTRLNESMSIVDAQIDNTRAWRAVFEECGDSLVKNGKACANVVQVASLLAGDIADEQRAGSIIETVHCERLGILSAMVPCLSNVSSLDAAQSVQDLLLEVSRMYSSLALPPLESIARRIDPPFHSGIFRVTFLVFWKINSDRLKLKDEQKSKMSPAVDSILRLLLTATRDLLVLVRARHNASLDDDFSMIVALLGQVLRSDFVPPTTVWIPHCQSLDLFRQAFEVFVHLNGSPASLTLGQHILDFGLVIASSAPALAELVAVEGVVSALTNNAISDKAADGQVSVFGPDGQRSGEHRLWTTQLALMVSLISSLGDNTRFVEDEVTSFVNVYRRQISNALGWNSSVALSLPLLEEMSYSVAIVKGLCQHPHLDSQVIDSLVDDLLNLLQHISYALLHPNHLLALVQPTSPVERTWLESDTTESSDVYKRPVLGCIVLIMLNLARTILDTFVAYTDAINVLTGDVTTWFTDRAIVKPTATVTTSEKSSIGTLFDIASYCLDSIKSADTSTNAVPNVPAPTSLSFPAYSTTALVDRCSSIMETLAVLATTQLALWLQKPEPLSRATTLMHRDISGELTTDLVAILDRAITTAETKKGVTNTMDSDLMKIMKSFAQKRLSSER